MSLNANSYFDDQVRSVGFERFGRKQSVGAIVPGTYRFGTEAAERMTIISGEARFKRKGSEQWIAAPAGSAFEVAADSAFEIACDEAVAYWCEYL